MEIRAFLSKRYLIEVIQGNVLFLFSNSTKNKRLFYSVLHKNMQFFDREQSVYLPI